MLPEGASVSSYNVLSMENRFLGQCDVTIYSGDTSKCQIFGTWLNERLEDAFLCRSAVITEFRHIFALVEQTYSSEYHEQAPYARE
jgi:hypothetical protein